MNKFTNVLALHCHTTGMNFKGDDNTAGHQPLSISLAVLDLDTLKPIDTLNVFVAYDPTTKWLTELEAIHGLTKEEALQGESMSDAATQVGGFIYKHFGTSKVPLLGYNVNNFHLPFLLKTLHSEELYFNFDERSIDLFPMATLLGKFGVYDLVESLVGEQTGHISSEKFVKLYTKMYKVFRFLVQNSLES